ncbi:hypothetical protein CAOG_00116 [Capsaspora owczarzaki ATCC 30864]|uniref:Prenylcysteine lyase domain-containing protein n=1 Tax=Capsaspora owczarzaki (strain ATCC 30864) TaxID=595528 RepID=A0A0D2VFF2_CAPO3|nr:hypothetical protein CAOG_00116 [Capsaspora owczarzaki ATCC 30864]KJE88462.1 hypothetical protein CAOG_000116 [Capsaspora owczarzaki ATCC 30864]|eukprot:XP_004364987.1 hypothetical protein CAOG_00116 [Capsaspora owczarzaki ATCC 30864]
MTVWCYSEPQSRSACTRAPSPATPARHHQMTMKKQTSTMPMPVPTLALLLLLLLLLLAVQIANAAQSPPLLTPTATATPPRIAIVGAGIGGGATAYYLATKHGLANTTVVFDSRDYIGGRLKHTIIDNQVIELGGDAYASPNIYMEELVKELNLPISLRRGSGGAAAAGRHSESLDENDNGVSTPIDNLVAKLKVRLIELQARAQKAGSGVQGVSGDNIGIWTGTGWIPLTLTLLDHLLSDTGTLESLAGFLIRLRENYVLRDDLTTPFKTVDAFLRFGDLEMYTNTTADTFFDGHGVAKATQQDLINPVLRVIYDQSLDESHAFGALVSLTSLIDAYSIATGNSKLVEALFAAAGSQVSLQSRVVSIAYHRDTKNWNLTYVSTASQDPEADQQHIIVDRVVIASPLEYTSILFINTSLSVTPRQFVHWYVTIIVAKSVNPAYFNEQPSFVVPEAVLTTQPKSGNATVFNVVQYIADADNGYHIYKIFSNDWVNSTLPELFVDIREYDVQVWPYTFPELVATTKFQPIELSPDLFYLNTMESIASAMEVSVIAGRNVAALVAKSVA